MLTSLGKDIWKDPHAPVVELMREHVPLSATLSQDATPVVLTSLGKDVWKDPSLHAPVVELVREHVPLSATLSQDATPVVLMHGMGDAGANPGMQSLASTISALYPAKYAVALSVADGLASIVESMDQQLAEFTRAVRADPKLRYGFDAVGLSQGNLLVHAYIARVNAPPVRRFVSVCGPMEGVGTCPANPLYEAICPLWKLDKYHANIAFSGYWKGVGSHAEYLAQNVFLPDILNERLTKNATYRDNMLKLEKLVLVKAVHDTMLVPRETSQHGFWPWGKENGGIVKMEASEGYKGDWIGLQTLDMSGRLLLRSFMGDHLRFSSQWWSQTILPVFA